MNDETELNAGDHRDRPLPITRENLLREIAALAMADVLRSINGDMEAALAALRQAKLDNDLLRARVAELEFALMAARRAS